MSGQERLSTSPPAALPLTVLALLYASLVCADQERLSEFDLKLMDIDSEHLGIPEAECVHGGGAFLEPVAMLCHAVLS